MMKTMLLDVHDLGVRIEMDYTPLHDEFLQDFSQFLIEDDRGELRCHIHTDGPRAGDGYLALNSGNTFRVEGDTLIFRGGDVFDCPRQLYVSDVRALFTPFVQVQQVLKRESVMLHSSAVRYSGRGIIFCGEKGTLKSSLAMEFILRGAKYMANDFTFIGVRDNTLKILGMGQFLTLDRESARYFMERQREDGCPYSVPVDSILDMDSRIEFAVKKKILITQQTLEEEGLFLKDSRLDYLIFPEVNLNCQHPRLYDLSRDQITVKLIQNIIPPRIGMYADLVPGRRYLDVISGLAGHIAGSCRCCFLMCGYDHMKNYECMNDAFGLA